MSSNLFLNKDCVYCGKPFIARTTQTKYCGSLCNSRHYKAKLLQEKIDLHDAKIAQNRGIKLSEITNDDYLSVKQAAELLGMSLKTIYMLIRTQKLHSYNFSFRKTLIRQKDIAAYFEREKQSGKIMSIPEVIEVDELTFDNSYTINEVMERYSISQSALYNLLLRFKIPKKQQGKYVLVRTVDIDELLA